MKSRSTAELLHERGRLIGAQPPHASGLGDTDILHDLLGADLTDAGQGLQERRNLHLSDGLIALALLQHLFQRRAAGLQAVLDLSTFPTSLSSLLKSCLTLF